MAILAKKVKIDDQENKEDNDTIEKNNDISEETKTNETVAEAKDFPPPPDKSPADNVADLSDDEELVGVKTIQDHMCNIGGRSYVFKAGERVMVPFNVKCILSRANLLRG